VAPPSLTVGLRKPQCLLYRCSFSPKPTRLSETLGDREVVGEKKGQIHKVWLVHRGEDKKG